MKKVDEMVVLQESTDGKAKKTLGWILAIIGVIAAIAGIAYAVYRFATPKYLEDFEDDFEDEYFEEE